jgi:hypothetical protein
MKTLQQSTRQLATRRIVLANPKHAEANRAALHQGLAHPLQAKLKLGSPDDSHEREADAVADRVMAMPQGAAQRKCEGCRQDEDRAGDNLRRQAVAVEPLRIRRYSGAAPGRLDEAPDSVARALADPGRPLDQALRSDMEQRFGHDFSRVRVHTGALAEQSAADVSARAYTLGPQLVFGARQFAPGAAEGRRLLAHELTHVIQQGAAESTIVAQDSEGGDSTLRRRDAAGGQPPAIAQSAAEATLQRAACPCCADSIAIGNISRIDTSAQMGHSFDVNLGLGYPASGPSGSCTLEWWEKTNVPAIPGHTPNTWTDMYALYPISPTFDPWKNRSERCATSSPVTITDPPSLAKRPGRTVNRTLEFRIVINSMPATSESGCAAATQQVTAKQELSMVNGAADWSASSFTTP